MNSDYLWVPYCAISSIDRLNHHIPSCYLMLKKLDSAIKAIKVNLYLMAVLIKVGESDVAMKARIVYLKTFELWLKAVLTQMSGGLKSILK